MSKIHDSKQLIADAVNKIMDDGEEPTYNAIKATIYGDCKTSVSDGTIRKYRDGIIEAREANLRIAARMVADAERRQREEDERTAREEAMKLENESLKKLLDRERLIKVEHNQLIASLRHERKELQAGNKQLLARCEKSAARIAELEQFLDSAQEELRHRRKDAAALTALAAKVDELSRASAKKKKSTTKATRASEHPKSS